MTRPKDPNFFFFVFIAIFFTLYGSLFFSYKLFYLSPLIIYLFCTRSYRAVLWLSCFLGLLVDLLSSHQRFGLYALNYFLTSSLLYTQKRNFFEDSLSTLPVLTFFYSICSTLIQMVLLFLFDSGIKLTWEFVKIDLLYLPLLDGLYAFTFFSIPQVFLSGRKRKGSDYFMASR